MHHCNTLCRLFPQFIFSLRFIYFQKMITHHINTDHINHAFSAVMQMCVCVCVWCVCVCVCVRERVQACVFAFWILMHWNESSSLVLNLRIITLYSA